MFCNCSIVPMVCWYFLKNCIVNTKQYSNIFQVSYLWMKLKKFCLHMYLYAAYTILSNELPILFGCSLLYYQIQTSMKRLHSAKGCLGNPSLVFYKNVISSPYFKMSSNRKYDSHYFWALHWSLMSIDGVLHTLVVWMLLPDMVGICLWKDSTGSVNRNCV